MFFDWIINIYNSITISNRNFLSWIIPSRNNENVDEYFLEHNPSTNNLLTQSLPNLSIIEKVIIKNRYSEI
jgi:hypothetical protein